MFMTCYVMSYMALGRGLYEDPENPSTYRHAQYPQGIPCAVNTLEALLSLRIHPWPLWGLEWLIRQKKVPGPHKGIKMLFLGWCFVLCTKPEVTFFLPKQPF